MFLSHHTVVWGILSLLCVILLLLICLFVILFVCLFLCTITDFSAAEKDRGVKFCTLARMLAYYTDRSSPLLVNIGSRRVTAAALVCVTSRMNAPVPRWQRTAPDEARWGFGIGCRGSVGQSELMAAALRKAVWWDLRLASLLTHLLKCFYSRICVFNDGIAGDGFYGVALSLPQPVYEADRHNSGGNRRRSSEPRGPASGTVVVHHRRGTCGSHQARSSTGGPRRVQLWSADGQDDRGTVPRRQDAASARRVPLCRCVRSSRWQTGAPSGPPRVGSPTTHWYRNMMSHSFRTRSRFGVSRLLKFSGPTFQKQFFLFLPAATSSSLASLKYRLVSLFWYWLTKVVVMSDADCTPGCEARSIAASLYYSKVKTHVNSENSYRYTTM